MTLENGEATITVRAPINMALIKYWGKRDEKLMIPMNDSISLTINGLHATTNIRVSTQLTAHSVTVNGSVMKITADSRFQRCFDAIKSLSRKRKTSDESELKFVTNWFCEVTSETNFPTEAGLASSAAGFAALVYGLGKIFGFDEQEIWKITRLGSGSACRSIFDGFVHWIGGNRNDGTDCRYAILENEFWWPELRAVIAVTSESSKDMGSTEGMRLSVSTSELLQYRVKECVPKHVATLKQAIVDKDFPKLAEVVMKESNQLHAICMDTTPPLNYLNQASFHLIKLVQAFNKYRAFDLDELEVAYTFDAGPNCCMFMREDIVPEFLQYLLHYCGVSRKQTDFVRGEECSVHEFPNQHFVNLPNLDVMPESVLYTIVSKVGGPPKILKSDRNGAH